VTTRIPESEFIAAWERLGSPAAVARELGLTLRVVYGRRKRLAAKGIVLPTQPRSTPYATSTLYDADGKTVLQWVKEKHHPDFIAAMAEAMRDVKPLPPIKVPRGTLRDKLAVYPWGDPHFGQYSWAEETGDDYDLDIAQKLHFAAVDALVARTLPARSALLVSVGDTTHGDDSTNQTPASKHTLDVDTRWRKVLRTTVLTFERCIQRLLEHHAEVEVAIVPGNHDPHAAAAIVTALEMLYRKNKRVTINISPSRFMYKRFGKCLIGITHGDTCRLEKLGELMACDRREDWGQTEHHHWFTGHWHHKRFYEGPDWTAEVLRTLAGKDAYAASHAYRSRRDMQSVVFDAERGEFQRNREDVRNLKP
jgi:hypothetical protein